MVYFWDKTLLVSVGVAVGRRSGGRLATTLVERYFHNSFLFFLHFFFIFSVVYFSHRRSARIKKLILRKLFGVANSLGIDPFPDPIDHFGAPPMAILDFEGGAGLQAVSKCPRRR